MEEQELKALEKVENEGGYLDMIISKVTSRKLMIWFTSLCLLCVGKLSSEQFLYVCMLYIGVQASLEILSIMKGKQ